MIFLFFVFFPSCGMKEILQPEVKVSGSYGHPVSQFSVHALGF